LGIIGFEMEQRRGSHNIVLIGFMGSGKSCVAKRLSEKLNMPYVDADSIIEEEEKREISQIFAEDGEPYFREKEVEVIKRLSEKRGYIISTGGGCVLESENIENLKKRGRLFFLKTEPEAVYKRIKDDGSRPLLNLKDPLRRIRELLRVRTPIYESCADCIIDTSNLTIEGVVERIIEEIKKDNKLRRLI
jgi:shikimate kinase